MQKCYLCGDWIHGTTAMCGRCASKIVRRKDPADEIVFDTVEEELNKWLEETGQKKHECKRIPKGPPTDGSFKIKRLDGKWYKLTDRGYVEDK